MEDLTHFNASGNAVMVDVTEKSTTDRRAIARCRVLISGGVPEREMEESLAVARVAGLSGAKWTSRLIPLCHSLPNVATTVTLSFEEGMVEIAAQSRTSSQTGVEMEALTACMVAALSVVSSLDGPSRTLVIDALELLDKRGGRSGHWARERTAQGDERPLG